MAYINLPSKKEYKRVYKSKKDNINHIYVYNTDRWRKLRIVFLSENPLCFQCLKKNIYTCSIDVHHIIPLSAANSVEYKQKIGFDTNNLMALCESCHKEIHLKQFNEIDIW